MTAKTVADHAILASANARFHADQRGVQRISPPGMARRRLLSAAGLSLAAAVPQAPAWALSPAPAQALAWPATSDTAEARYARLFASLGKRIDMQWTDVQSVAVVHRGALAFEHYRAGITADTLQDTQSVTKSVLSLLVGCALADGLLRSTDELVAPRLPEMLRVGADARVRRLRFAHLLTMTAGWPGEETARRDRDDDVRQIVRRPFVADPGARFAYDNGAANLLALALARAVGKPLSAYASQRLLAPLGIQRFEWREGAKKHTLGALGLSLTTRAMARLGELVLAQGQWQGRALVPADYLGRATQRQNAGGAPLFAPYGYLWWVSATAPRQKGARPTAMASGYGGQWIHVQPEQGTVVAVTSRRTPESMARNQGASLIRTQILPALQRV